jgi:hypothetical protein
VPSFGVTEVTIRPFGGANSQPWIVDDELWALIGPLLPP